MKAEGRGTHQIKQEIERKGKKNLNMKKQSQKRVATEEHIRKRKQMKEHNSNRKLKFSITMSINTHTKNVLIYKKENKRSLYETHSSKKGPIKN